MPQVFQVLKCYKCSVFQIHLTKKSNKFECKICTEKQSIKRHYGIGTGKDCRMHVQKLNVLRGNTDIKSANEIDSDVECEVSQIDEKITENINNSETLPVKRSKWSAFIDKEKERDINEEPMFLGDREVFLELPRKTKTPNFKAKAKSNNSEEYLPSINSNFKGQLKTNLEFNIENNVDNFRSEERHVHNTQNNDTSTIRQEQVNLSNVNNLLMEKSLEKPVVLQTVDKSSRWAQYVNTEEDDADTHSVLLPNHDSKECISNSDNLFALCDDNDLDEVLDV